MPLETGDYICDLVETNPPGTDNVSQGDDHLRLIKHILLTQFPALCAPVTATADDLNNAGKSGMPIVTTYTTAAAAQTHTLDAGTSWIRMTITGGGAGGGSNNLSPGGGGGGTAIKVIAVGDAPNLTYTVGAGGIIGGAGENSVVVVNTSVDPLTVTGEGGLAIYDWNSALGTAGGINGDQNIHGGGGIGYGSTEAATYGIGSPGVGGGTYWGGGYGHDSFATPDDAGAFGCGGRGRTSQQGASVGNTGVVVIEEY